MLIIADNQPLTRDALTGYFPDQPLRHVANKRELIAQLEAWNNALVILDFTLFDFTTPENLLIFLRRFQQVRWLLLSAEFAPNLIHLLGSEPQVSFLTKDCTRNDIQQAVYKMRQGDRTICSAVQDILNVTSERDHNQVHLTQTERAILVLIAQGKSAKAIADERCSSVHTIVTHKKNIFRKLGVSTAYEATRYALRAGWAVEAEYNI